MIYTDKIMYPIFGIFAMTTPKIAAKIGATGLAINPVKEAAAKHAAIAIGARTHLRISKPRQPDIPARPPPPGCGAQSQ